MTQQLMDHVLNDKFDGYLLIKKATQGTTTNGSAFLTLTLTDQSGDIDAKLWNTYPAQVSALPAGTIVKITGIIGEYNNKPQFTVHKIDVATDSDPISLAELIPSAPISQVELTDTIQETVASLQNPDLQQLVHAFVAKYDEDLFTYPAASGNHHAYRSGLAHHICGMLEIGESMCKIHPTLNRDLLLSGIILHDIGKIHEYESVLKPSFTLEGAMLGHISIMMAEIGQMAKDLNIDSPVVMLLQHMVLSHHHKGEWGSPKAPIIQEAEVLHYIDMLDAKLNTLGKALSKTAPGEFTERLYSLDNRSFYHHNLDQ